MNAPNGEARAAPFKERLLFTLLSAAAGSLVALLARRLIEKAWRLKTGRHPPETIGLLSPAGKRAGEGAASFLLERVGRLRA